MKKITNNQSPLLRKKGF